MRVFIWGLEFSLIVIVLTSCAATVQDSSATIPKRIIGKDGAPMVLIPAGEFQMGGAYSEERPVHTVNLDAFYIDKYEVTNAQYKKFLEANPQWRKDQIDRKYHNMQYLQDWDENDYPGGKGDYPVAYVSWYAAKAYAEWAGKRLPTEAEWEKAARGGLVGKQYPRGNRITHDDANYGGSFGKDFWNGTSPVASFPPNGYGLYDVAGNILEWCADWYDSEYYARSPKENPRGPSSGEIRVRRGGSWSGGPGILRVACRLHEGSDAALDDTGFRCVQDIKP